MPPLDSGAQQPGRTRGGHEPNDPTPAWSGADGTQRSLPGPPEAERHAWSDLPRRGDTPDPRGGSGYPSPDELGRLGTDPASSWLEQMRRETRTRTAGAGASGAAVTSEELTGPPQPSVSPRSEEPPSRGRQRDGSKADAATVLTAVRELPGVRGAELVGEPGRPQVLRLDLV
ncbi:MAG TPA: hypothetical protein VHJ83_09625, partial [Micromonosporaceae bacterium]|nr:hypothetical protein [Micromonosporaceae bacterium]